MPIDHLISLDMVKVNFKSKSDITGELLQRFWDSHLDQGEHWTSAKYSDYEHVWTFPSGSSVVTIMYAHNSQSGKERKTGAIEWNPNKVDFGSTPDLWILIKELLMFSSTFEFSKADIAYDLPAVSIHQCTIDKGYKAHARFYMGSNETMTIYSGARGSSGSCKVYDKRREVLDNGGQDIGVMTRFEITYKANITFFKLPRQDLQFQGGIIHSTIPQLVVMNQPTLDAEISTEDNLIIAGLQQLPHLYCMLSKYKRKRIKELECVNTFVPSIEKAEMLMMSWFQAFHASIIA